MAAPRCPACIEVGTLTCSGCNNAKYCSILCQQTDWQFHKALCKSFKSLEPRPSPDMRRVIYFPSESLKPEFKWLPLRRLMDDEDNYEVAQSVDYRDMMGDCCVKQVTFNRNIVVDTKLDLAVALCFDDAFSLDYSTDNKAVISATNKMVGFGWRGPLLAYCGHVQEPSYVLEIIRVKDMDMMVFSDLIAYLIDYGNDSQYYKLRKGPKVKAAKANCTGERRHYKAPFAHTVYIPRMHPIFDKGETSQISQKIGMPLILMKEAFKKYPETSRGPHDIGDYCIPQVTFMHLACDPSLDRFGWAPLHWLGGEVPNVLICRLDRKPLEPDDVEAFGDFCQYHLQSYFQWQQDSMAHGNSDDAACKQLVVKQMTEKGWSIFVSQWRKKRSISAATQADDSSFADLIDKVDRMGLDADDREKVMDRLFDKKGFPLPIKDLR